MYLKTLIKDLPDISIKGPKNVAITGISSNSKLIAPGNLFVAKKGATKDGAQFIPEAIRAGAVAILCDMYDPSLSEICQLICRDVRSSEGLVAAAFYENPSYDLDMTAITGTKGKTTVSYALRHILESSQKSCGLIGTVEYIVKEKRYAATHTTPDVCTNHKMLREMAMAGCSSCVMEVTSHSLDQKRVQGIDFDCAIYTNLSHEHLDYHKSMEKYAQTKELLFKSLGQDQKSKKSKSKKYAIINNDDPWSHKIVPSPTSIVLTYGIKNSSDVMAKNIEYTNSYTRFDVVTQSETCTFEWPMIGIFNVYNALSVIAAGLTKNISLQAMKSALKTFKGVPGRLERVDNMLNLHIYVDYAHCHDPLQNVLGTIRQFCKGRIITVFGCGGDRDKEKRPLMAKVAESLSDVVIVTSDNPRSENPNEIIRQIVEGFSQKEKYYLEADRRKAIAKACSMALPEDIVLIAGKGHETKQIFSHHTIEFDDRIIAKECCQIIQQAKKIEECNV